MQSPSLHYTVVLWGDYQTMGTAPTEGRVAKPERRWGYRRGTPTNFVDPYRYVYIEQLWKCRHLSSTS